MSSRPVPFLFFCSFFAVSSGCGAEGTRTAPGAITWQRDVRPIAARACVDCHAEGQVAPFAMDDPAVVRDWADVMVNSVETRRMPPWGMDASCREVPDSKWLTDAELATFAAWRDGGFAMGDEADYAAPPPPEPSIADSMGPPDLALRLEPYTPDTSAGPDDYRCLPIGDVVQGELYLRGVRTTPSNLAIAHHVILFAVPEPLLGELEAKDAADPGPGYTCFGDSGIDNSMTVGGWAPGRDGTFLPDGVAQRIPAGSRFVVQMHYNTSGALAGDPGADETSVELWTMPDGEVPPKVMVVYPIVNLGLSVAPGVEDTVVARQRLAIRGELVGTTPHLHKRGRTLETTLIRPDGEEQCLSRVPHWQFGWQNSYAVPAGQGIPVSIDDEIEIACSYDNTDNDAPLTWGEGTADEMCLDYVGVVVDWNGGTTGGVCSGVPICGEACDPTDPFCALECMAQSGDSCLFCGLEALTSDCVGFQCIADGLSLSVCMDTCGDPSNFEDVVRCFHDDCRTQFESYWQCAGPALESGSCPDEVRGCAELVR